MKLKNLLKQAEEKALKIEVKKRFEEAENKLPRYIPAWVKILRQEYGVTNDSV